MAAKLARIRLHDTRHTAASLMAAGLPLVIMSERLGHSSTAITGDVYRHSLPAQHQAAADTAFAQMFRDEGLEVSWEGPLEKRTGGVPELVQLVYYLKANAGSGLVGGASYALAQAAVRKIRERLPSALSRSPTYLWGLRRRDSGAGGTGAQDQALTSENMLPPMILAMSSSEMPWSLQNL